MYIIVYQYLGKNCGIVAPTKRLAMKALTEVQSVGFAQTWRALDGKGHWCDGSPGAGEVIQTLCTDNVMFTFN